MRYLGILLFAALSLSGCMIGGVSAPKALPQPATTEGCPNLNGAYQNHSRDLGEDSSSIPLADILDDLNYSYDRKDEIAAYKKQYPVYEFSNSPSNYVVISHQGTNSLGVTGKSGAATSFAYQMPMDNVELSCSGGWMEIALRTKPFRGGEVLLGYSGQSHFFTRGTDGSLIMKTREITAGLLFALIPVGAYGAQWYYFPPASGV